MKNTICLIVTALCVISCTERIEIDTKDAKEHLVIYGVITDENPYQHIEITRSAPYFSTEPPRGVSGAAVTVTDASDRTYTFTESGTKPGLYRTDGMTGVSGDVYTLHVKLDFDGDGIEEEYTAAACMPESTIAVKLKLEPEPDPYNSHYADLVIWGILPPGNDNCYRYSVNINHRPHPSDTLSHMELIEDKFFNRKVLDSLAIYMFDQKEEVDKIYRGDVVELRMSTITRDYHNYLQKIRSEVWTIPPMFDSPPANVASNIEQTSGATQIPVIGYFSACPITTISTTADRTYAW